MKNNYPTKKLGEVLDYEQPGKYIVNSKNYSNDYKTPVLTAGKTFILGNTDEKENIFPIEKLPVIIFDDFTTAIKFVDFPFKVKSSAMKILHAKKNIADVKYVFYAMQTTAVNHATHKRYWISEYSNIQVPLPPLAEQKKIVARLEGLLGKIKEAKRLREEAQEAAQNLLPAELHKIFSQQGSYSLIRANKRIVGKPTTPHKQHPYKLENIGMSGKWEEKELGEITELVTKGTTPKTLGHAFTESGVPFLKAENVNGGEIDATSTHTFISKETHDILSRSKTKNGDVLMTIAGTIGRIGWIAGNAPEMNMNQAVAIIRPKHDIVFAPYLAYVLSAGITQVQVSSGIVKAAIPNFSLGMIKKLKIPLPPLAEQKKIVARLDSLSEKIKNLQEYQKSTASDFIFLEQSILFKAFQ